MTMTRTTTPRITVTRMPLLKKFKKFYYFRPEANHFRHRCYHLLVLIIIIMTIMNNSNKMVPILINCSPLPSNAISNHTLTSSASIVHNTTKTNVDNQTSSLMDDDPLLFDKLLSDDKEQQSSMAIVDYNDDDDQMDESDSDYYDQMQMAPPSPSTISESSTTLFQTTMLDVRSKRNNLGSWFGRKRSNIVNGGFLGKNLFNSSMWQHYLEPWTANPNYWIADRYHDNVVCLLASFSGTIHVRPANTTFRGGTFSVSPEESLGRRANCERNSRNIFWKFSQHDEREIVIDNDDRDGDGDSTSDQTNIADEVIDDDFGDDYDLFNVNNSGQMTSSGEIIVRDPDPDFTNGIDRSLSKAPFITIQNDQANGVASGGEEQLLREKKRTGKGVDMSIGATTMIERSNRLLSAGFHVVGSVIEFHVAYIECLQIVADGNNDQQHNGNVAGSRPSYQIIRDIDVCTNLSVSFDLGSFGNPQAYECNHIWSKTLKDIHYNQNKRRYAGEVQISLKWVRIDKDPLGVAPYSFRKARKKCVWDTIFSWQSLTIIGSLLFFFIIGFFGLCVCSNSSCHDETGEWSNWCCLFCRCCCRRGSNRSGHSSSPHLVQYNHTVPSTRLECNHHARHRGPPPPPPPPSSSTSLLTNTSSHPNHFGCGHRKPTFSNSYSYEGTGSNPTQQSSSSAMSTAIDDYYYYKSSEDDEEEQEQQIKPEDGIMRFPQASPTIHRMKNNNKNELHTVSFNESINKLDDNSNNDEESCDHEYHHYHHHHHYHLNGHQHGQHLQSSTSIMIMANIDIDRDQNHQLPSSEDCKNEMQKWSNNRTSTICHLFFMEFLANISKVLLLNFVHMKRMMDRLRMATCVSNISSPPSSSSIAIATSCASANIPLAKHSPSQPSTMMKTTSFMNSSLNRHTINYCPINTNNNHYNNNENIQPIMIENH